MKKYLALLSSLKGIFNSCLAYHFVDINKMVVLYSNHIPDVGNMINIIQQATDFRLTFNL